MGFYMIKIPTFCFIHKYVIVDVIVTKSTWFKTYGGKTVEGSEHIQHPPWSSWIPFKYKYKVKLKCKYCDKVKFRSGYDDELSDGFIAECDFWLRENKDK